MTENHSSEARISSGKEAVNDFFENITAIPGVDPATAESIGDLYKDGNLTKQSILDALKKIRESSV